MQKSDLDELIEYYESEKKALEYHVKEALEVPEDMDFESAHLFTKAIGMVNEKLRVLNILKDPDYEERKLLNYLKGMNEKTIKNDKDVWEYYNDEINDINQKLESLDQKPRRLIDTQYIDDAFYDLIERKIKSFKINLTTELSLTFTLYDTNIININLPELNESNRKLSALKSIGFEPNSEQRLEYRYLIAKKPDSLHFKTILSKIIYDTLQYSPREARASIEISSSK